MPFARQVSIGRVALVNFPEAEAGKLVVISDVVSANAVSSCPGRQQCDGRQGPSCWAPCSCSGLGSRWKRSSRGCSGLEGRPPRQVGCRHLGAAAARLRQAGWHRRWKEWGGLQEQD
jgi:hypothetical protein